MDRLKGKTAIVVGAGSIGPGWGNGKAVAVQFAREGARVLAVDLREHAAFETRDVITRSGGTCEAFVGDVSKGEVARRMVERCVEVFGTVDVLHNNAGAMVPGGPCEVSEDDWDRAFTTNIRTMFLACRFVLPIMERQRNGSIVNIGSVSASRFLGMPALAYSTSKGAVMSFTRALAAQYGPHKIRSNVITPGIIDTPVLAMVADRIAASTNALPGPQAKAARERTVPLGRFGSAWDVAHAAVYLASEEASYVNGAELVIDGGLSCMAPQPQGIVS